MSLSVDLLRADDLLSLHIEAINLQLDTADPANPKLVRTDPSAETILVVVFPPQAIAEEAFYESSLPITPLPGEPERGTTTQNPRKPPGMVLSRMAGVSRLAFKVPRDVESIPYTIAGLTDWSHLEPSLSPIAAAGFPAQFGPDTAPVIRPPLDVETGLEFPYRLIISPDSTARWRNAATPVTHQGRSELWHTRLVVPRVASDPVEPALVELNENHTASFRAIWSPDYSPLHPPTHNQDDKPFLGSLSPLDRHTLVQSMSDLTLVNRGRTVGIPAQASRLMLSTLGGWLDSRGAWPDAELTEWRHLATMARDHYVRVVYSGRLFPLKHRASLVKITERRFEELLFDRSSIGSPTAFLRQFMYIVPRDRELVYTGEPYEHSGREMPFTPLVRINTLSTPKIDKPVFLVGTKGSFWIDVGQDHFPFSVTAQDIGRNRVDFPARMIFVDDNDNNPAALKVVRDAYLAGPRDSAVKNQRVTFAPAPSGSDTTTLTTGTLRFDAELNRGDGGFLPFLETADVRVHAVEQLVGSEKPTTIKLFSGYLSGNLDPHAGVFAELVAAPLPVEFAAQQSGGIARPNLSVTGLSAVGGPIAGDLGKAALNQLDPADFFKDLSPTLFGVLPISDLISPSAGFASAAPKITTEARPNASQPTEMVTTLHWSINPIPHSLPGIDFQPDSAPDAPGLLNIDVVVTKPFSQSAATQGSTSVTGSLKNFHVTLKGVITIGFDEFKFASVTGQKTQVEIHLKQVDPVEFLGALAFVHKLTDIIPPGLLGNDGPKILLKPESVEVGFAIDVPPLTLGVFSLTGLGISSSLTLPFLTGKPQIGFAFSERHKPFLLTVSLLGGGGFFHLELDTESIILVEAQLEFGGEFALDIGVASGSVHVMAGIYFALKTGATELTGFVDLGGEVSVLGLISVSVEFNLSLTYDFQQDLARGEATLTVAVSIAFFSESVSLSVERSFSAGSDHISIGQVMTPDDWAAYSLAFA